MQLLYVPAGEFKMGSENRDDNESPVHVVALDAFWIDQTEITNGMNLNDELARSTYCGTPPTEPNRGIGFRCVMDANQ